MEYSLIVRAPTLRASVPRASVRSLWPLLCLLVPRVAATQIPQDARHWFEEGKRTGLIGHADSSLLYFTRAWTDAKSSGAEAMTVAAARGRADVWLVLRGCADSAVRILRDAQASAPPGDRSAAEALVRLLASRGDVPAARAALVAAYADVGGVGRTITRESIAYLRGRAVVERAGGQESAALSTYNEALIIATRLHEGDANDTTDIHASGEVTSENAWVLFDLAQLRAHAKSPSIASARESARVMGLLLAAWDVVDDPGATPFPTVRLGDRLVLRAEQCRRAGTSCPVPKPPKGC
ncbi:MAG: hypothetical protein IPP90_14160 [Gemmatimonadaceae bacterium]|nr:hypothetical protein [Gemmatimonadaceae bacterium]